jgi:mono/diheme cytochrome c family protein
MKQLVFSITALATVSVFAAPPPAAKPADAKAKVTITGDAAKGAAKFKELCTSCHGEAGKGDGPAAVALNPKPANFADPVRAAAATDEYIVSMIKEGGAANGKSALMASWKGALNDAQIQDVAAYVRSLSKGAAAPAATPAPAAKEEKKPAPKK